VVLALPLAECLFLLQRREIIMSEKKYYWLKLKETYFDSPKIKMLRKIAGGDTFTIIYLKMQLISIRNEGILKYEGIDVSFADEIALKIDEDVENVKVVLSYLEKQSLLEFNETQDEMLLTEASESIGSEGESAERVRKFRKNQKLLQCNEDVTNPLISNILSLISNIFNYWNTKNIIVHKTLTDDISKAIEKALKTYNETEIKTCIDRYATVLNDKSYFLNYKWSLKDFLSRKDGISSFTDEGSKWNSYQDFLITPKKAEKQQTYVADYTDDFEGVF
jgi:predicted phage replisome organizer